MKLKSFFLTNTSRKKKKDAGAHVFASSWASAKADVLQINESSHRVDEDGNVELNFDDSEVQRVLKKRLDSLRDYDLAEDSAKA